MFHLDGNSAALYIGANGNEGDIPGSRRRWPRRVHDGRRDGRRCTSAPKATRATSASATATVATSSTSTAATPADMGGSGNEGDVSVHNDAGDVTIHLDGGSGDIKLLGADLAEDFASATEIEPGSVVVAVGARRGRGGGQAPATGASSAWPPAPAAAFRRSGSAHGPARSAVRSALAGRVYCKADAALRADRARRPPDHLDDRGHAMRVEDPAAAPARSSARRLAQLERGEGLIPVLLALR